MDLDRRVDARVSGENLRACIGDRYYDLADVALGGARILGLVRPVGDTFPLELVDGAGRVTAAGTVCAAAGNGVSVTFDAPTYALMTWLARHGA